MGSVWAVQAVALLVLVGATTARAEESREHAARAQFLDGVELYEEGAFEAALAAFRNAYEARPHPAILNNIAWTLSRLERAPEALENFERYMEQSGDEPSDRLAAAREEVERLRSLLGELVLRVTPPDAELQVDGTAVETTAGRAHHHVLPGRRTVVVRRSDYIEQTRTVTARAGQTDTLEVTLEPGQETTTTGESLSVRARPAGRATVTVDGEPWSGDGPIAVGDHDVVASAARRLDWRGTVQVRAGEQTTLTVDLARQGIPRVWFWSSLGLTLATGLVAAITGGLARRYQERWVQDWSPGDRETGESLARACEGLIITLALEVVGTVIVGLITDFGLRSSQANVTFSGQPTE